MLVRHHFSPRDSAVSRLVFIYAIAMAATLAFLPAGGAAAQTTTPTSEELESRDRVVEAADIKILRRAKEILAEEAVWDRADDRVCGENDTKWSLFCALYQASIEIDGAYDHRRVAMQEVRFAIDDVSGDREFNHRLMDFNNQPDMTSQGVHDVIDIALSRVIPRLDSAQ